MAGLDFPDGAGRRWACMVAHGSAGEKPVGLAIEVERLLESIGDGWELAAAVPMGDNVYLIVRRR